MQPSSYLAGTEIVGILSKTRRYKVLLLTTVCDEDDVGEAWNARQWVARLADKCDLTVLTMFSERQRRPSQQVPAARIIEWKQPGWFSQYKKFNSMLKPTYIDFYRKSLLQIRQLQAAGEHFEIFHQLTPIAIRYPSPLVNFDVPYILGPLSGGLSTPVTFQRECGGSPWYTRLRRVDQLRLRFDPMLRKSYARASVILGAAPYIRDLLSAVPINRFEVECEVGINDIEAIPNRRPALREGFRLLYVGRAVRTKGMRDAVRAMGHLVDLPQVTLTIAGDGEDLETCRDEARALGIGDRIQFLGRVPRQQVENLYAQSDLFVFPSFREPTGGVILEAMRHGLPVIATDIGGPGFIVTEHCGLKIPVTEPAQFARDIASAIRTLAQDRATLDALGRGARARVSEIGLWDNKIKRVLALYQEVIEASQANKGKPSRI